MPQGGHPLRGSFVSYTVHWKKCDQICQSLGLDLIEFDHRLAVQLSTDSTLGTRWATCLGHSSLGGLVTCLLARCSWPEYGQLRYYINFYTGLLISTCALHQVTNKFDSGPVRYLQLDAQKWWPSCSHISLLCSSARNGLDTRRRSSSGRPASAGN